MILLDNLTRGPELKHTEGKNPSVSLGWQRIDRGQLRLGKSKKSPSITALLPGRSWARHATSISEKAGKSTLREGCNPIRTLAKTG
jgi:hypothetical protein